MEPSVDRINAVLRPSLKRRLGTQENINGARAIALREWGQSSINAGQLAYAMVMETALWADNNLSQIYIPPNALNNYVVQNITNICAKANSTHGKGSKAVAGAAVGSYFGVLGAAVGGILGWALGQNAANNDLESIIFYAGQAIDYMCDCFCNSIQALIAQSQRPEIPKSNVEKTTPVKTKASGFPRFDDVIGLEEAKQAVEERVIKPSLNPEIYKKYGKKVGGGILLYGLPGTGKTMFAQAVANEINGKFFSIKASDLKSKYYGETEGKIKSLFDEARKEKVAIIFIDEFEAIGMDRNKAGNDLTISTVVPELLAQMQGFEQEQENILLVIAATNRPWDIDSALTRPGRFDYKVYVDLPNENCRYSMFKHYLAKTNVDYYELSSLSKRTEGYNGSDIKNISDALIQIIIDKEIAGVMNYRFSESDINNVLERIKSSVSPQDVFLMNAFRNQR